MDRGYAKYELFNHIVEAGTSRSTAEATRASKNYNLSSRGTPSASPTAFHAARIDALKATEISKPFGSGLTPVFSDLRLHFFLTTCLRSCCCSVVIKL
jgi:hypothetical protein